MQNEYIERRLTLSMIRNTSFIKRIRPRYKSSFIQDSFSKVVVGWCMEHYKLYKEAPKADILLYYDRWAKKLGEDDDRVELVGDLLYSYEKEYEKFDNINVDYVVKESFDYFHRREIEQLRDDLKVALDNDKQENCEKIVNEFKHKQKEVEARRDIFNDPDAVRRAFESVTEPLIRFPGAYGRMVNPHLIKGGFVGVMGAEKSGKTWHLMNMAFTGWRQGNNVAYFEAGDLTREQFIRRMGVYFTRGNYDLQYTGQQKKPIIDCIANQQNFCKLACKINDVDIIDDEDAGTLFEYKQAKEMGYQTCDVCRKNKDFENFKPTYWYEDVDVPEIGWMEAYDKMKFWNNKLTRGKKFKVEHYSNGTLTLNEMESKLQHWKDTENFIPEIIVIDYIDIMDHVPPTGGQLRDGINASWMGTRRFSQDWDSLVIAGTQTNAESYDKQLLDRSNFSEDKRKYSHVTAMLGINQTEKEKEKSVMRWNVILVREGASSLTKYVTVLQFLPAGRAFTDSF